MSVRSSRSRSQVLADFAVTTRLEDIPADVVRKAGLHLLDTLGVALAGSRTPEAVAAREALGAATVGGGAVVWGTADQAPPATAALLNGIAAHALELDDTDGCDHSGAVVVPAVLAAASVRRSSGSDLVRAVVIGYDVARRVLDAAGGYAHLSASGWHTTGVCGAYGAAAAAAALLDLDSEKHSWALGLAASAAGSTWSFIDDGAMSKRLNAGRAAESGTGSALLARAGFTGPTRVFEADWGGFLPTYAPNSSRPEALTADLGQRWLLEAASIKPHASCRDTHSAIDVVLDHADLTANTVRAVEIRLPRFIATMCGGVDITTTVDAQLSLPFCVCAALVHGRVGPAEVVGQSLHHPRLRRLLANTRVLIDDDAPPTAVPTLRFTMTDGTVRRITGRAPLGSPERPFTSDQVIDKFTRLTSEVLSTSRAQQLVDLVLTLEQQVDTDDLSLLLSTPPRT